jgi:hypothetical protein
LKTIIAGTRTITDPYILIKALDNCGWEPTRVLCGMARGADALGEQWAMDCGIPIYSYPAVWRIGESFDRFAGFKRNAQMAKDAEALIALWDGYSKGTAHMIDEARRQKLRVHVELV